MIDPTEIRPQAEAESFKTLRWMNGSRKQFVVRVVDEYGSGVDLEKEPQNPPARKPRFSYQTEVAPGTVAVKLLVLNETVGSPCNVLFEIEGEVLKDCEGCDDCTGLVEFDFDPLKEYCPGVYLGQIVRFVHGGYIVDSYPIYFSVEPSLAGQWAQQGMITIPEVRLALGDHEIGEVSLLDEFEFEDTEIVAAVRWVVDKWNNTPPPVNTYTYYNFPYRYWWIKGAVIELLRMAARRYAKNQLAYQAGGITIDDQNKAGDYEGIAKRMYAEFDEWFKMEKRRQNMDRAWSSNSIY